ncbi:MAG: LysR family transcriptional regulator [Neisseriaceae bacterium]|nr:LysR family transcriptional regulator [Neisseriaceae bacterium]MBP6860827.1 LysR family transcriptional regulator [Neisseriaceae bacterium]
MDRLTAAKVFLTIVEKGSLSAAADALDMSRAMVTRYLATMERWAKARLLHRSTRKLTLTDAGEQAVLRCEKIMVLAAEIDLIEDQNNHELHGLLRISCSQSLGQSAIAPAVAAFLKQHPALRIDLNIDNQAVNLIESRIDLALRITNNLDPNIIAKPLATCHSILCATPAYLAEHGMPHSLAELTQHNCLTYSYFNQSLWPFQHLERTEPEAVMVSGNLSANESVVLLSATLAHAGISLQPAYSVREALAAGTLVPLLTDYQPQPMGIYGLYASRKHMPQALRALLDFLSQWFLTHPL